MNAAWFAASLLSGYLVNKLGTYKKLMVVSFAVLVAGMVGFIAVDQDPSAVVVGGLLAVMGFGVGLNFEILVLVVQNEFPASAVGMATAATGFFRKVGSVLGTSVRRAAHERPRAPWPSAPRRSAVGALGTDANCSRRPRTRAPRTCAMRWAAYSDALAPVLWLALPLAVAGPCSCCSWRDAAGHHRGRIVHADEGADDPAAAGRARQPAAGAASTYAHRSRPAAPVAWGYTTFMSELFFDTIDESEIPAGMARVRYEAGAVEPLYANDEFFSLLGYQRRSPDDFYPLDVRNSHGWRAFCGQLRAHIEAGETDFEIEVNQETATGTLLWTMARCRHDARRGTVTCLVLDVSSWMDTSERLRMSEDAFRIAAQMSGKNIATFDLADRALTMQGAVEGYLTAPARMVNVPDSAIAAGMIAPEHVELYRSLYRDMETGVPRGGVMLRMRDFDTRRFRWYQVDYSLVFDGENRPVRRRRVQRHHRAARRELVQSAARRRATAC
ncbi:MAG: MFS transporter [Eggerthella lenta]